MLIVQFYSSFLLQNIGLMNIVFLSIINKQWKLCTSHSIFKKFVLYTVKKLLKFTEVKKVDNFQFLMEY